MDVNYFIRNYRKFFGEAELPLVFWYDSSPEPAPVKSSGCFLRELNRVREGEALTLDGDCIGCRGGKIYAGYMDFNDSVAQFVSCKERYKQTPEMVSRFITDMDFLKAPAPYLHFARIDGVEDLGKVEGLIFYARPDVLTGLVAWTFFDTNERDAVSVLFGSGCSAVVSQVLAENHKGGKRTFLGLFDPSVRLWVEEDILSFGIPYSRFREMYETMEACCLNDTPAWNRVKKRINHEI